MLTLEEAERRAYADGDVERARLYALALDGDGELQMDLHIAREQKEDLNKQLDAALERIAELEGAAGIS